MAKEQAKIWYYLDNSSKMVANHDLTARQKNACGYVGNQEHPSVPRKAPVGKETHIQE